MNGDELNLREKVILFVLGRDGPIAQRAIMDAVNAIWDEFELDGEAPYRISNVGQVARALKLLDASGLVVKEEARHKNGRVYIKHWLTNGGRALWNAMDSKQDDPLSW